MSTVGQPERATQNRVIALFRDELGYRYLGDWTDRDGNSNIEDGLLSAWLTNNGYTPAQIIDTYIEADEPRKISPFDNMSLLDLIVKSGIANAINIQLGGVKGNKDAVAETIENNVRSKIIKEHLSDPAYYEKMSALLDEIIAARRAKAIEYEAYLKKIAELAAKVQAGQAEDTPETLNTPGRRALYNNLNQSEALALKIDEVVKKARPDGWRGIQAREQVVKAALYGVLQDESEVERIFLIIKQQAEY